ncbi:MAG: pantoate--beta-alanine ligase [Prevotellaceae bacterium]|nr:pantoate--beta-alanine ligase [Prevotellaceae bacterium]
MVLIHTAAELRGLLLRERAAGHSVPSVAHLASSPARWAVGLVPTMGALHEGHLSLVRRSLEENDVTVVSIFLNPTQFNDKKDLERYPSNLEADCRLLGATGQGIVAFAPTVSEMYPEPDTRRFSYPPTDSVMEGSFRPGHFNGVCQIVSKLFLLVEPDRAYFGEKDYQQIAVVRRMVEALRLPVSIVPCPTVRSEGGLALSSRNALLDENEKHIACNIYKTLSESLALMASHSVREVHDFVVTALNAVPGLEVQYFSIVDGKSLADVSSWQDSDDIVGCITVFCGKLPVRLIDHIKYR